MKRLVLTDPEFEALRGLLARAAGLAFDESRRESLAYSVAERLRDTGAGSVAAYLVLLDGAQERQRLVDEVTIQETHFFRNPPQVRALRQSVLPELLRTAEAEGRPLRIWSAGCSTGEEPYTVAMLLRGLQPAQRGPGTGARVLATDVSQSALAAARLARYGNRAVQMAAPEDLARFFVHRTDGSWSVRDEVRESVELRHHNLVTDPPPFARGEVDLVLCRNVTIYFGRETTRELVQRFSQVLRPGGYLFLGHSETLWQVSEEFGLVTLGSGDSAAFVYRRRDPSPARPAERRSVLLERRTGVDPPPSAGPDRRRGTRRGPVPAAPTGADLLRQSRSALQSGRYEQAAELAAQVAAQTPLDAGAHYLRGVALSSLGRDAEALVDLRKAVYLAPEDGFAHFLLAGVLGRLGDPVAARREYAAAADTLGRRPADTTAPELGGRSVQELRALCQRLAQEAS